MSDFGYKFARTMFRLPDATASTQVASRRAAGLRLTNADVARHQLRAAHTEKINGYFASVKAADQKKSDPYLTTLYVRKREQETALKKNLLAIRIGKNGPAQSKEESTQQIKEHLEKISAVKKDIQHFYVPGPMGQSHELLKKRRHFQKKSAVVEPLHTIFGARVWNATSGIAGPEMASTAARVGLHQGIGYFPQSFLSGGMRIITEVIQQRINKGGKPKLPANLATSLNFKQIRHEITKAVKELEEGIGELRKALAPDAVHIPSRGQGQADADPRLEHVRKVRSRVTEALKTLKKFDTQYENLCITLERECRGKRGSAVVSILAGAASFGAYAVEPTGVGAVVGHKLLSLVGVILQGPASYYDYLDSTIDFPQKIGAKKIDLDMLYKEESRKKPFKDRTVDDIDVNVANSLFEEQPKLVAQTIRSIYTRECSELNGSIIKIRNSPVPRSKKDEEKLKKHEKELADLHTQIGLFEQHRGDELDPGGLIGKCIVDAVYFCRKGMAANLFGKAGEFWAQANQRFANNFNPMFGLGLFSLAFDAVSLSGESFQLGAEQLHGGGVADHGGDAAGQTHPHPTSEAATAALIASGILASVNSGVTVGPSRFNKVIHDRVALSTPAWFAKGKKIGIPAEDDQNTAGQSGVVVTRSSLKASKAILAARRAELKQAYDMGLISSRKVKKLEKASDLLEYEHAIQTVAVSNGEQREARDQKEDVRLLRMEARWARFDQLKQDINKTTTLINRDWLITLKDANGVPLKGYDNKPIVVDMRASVACQEAHMPRMQRWMTPIKGVPRSLVQSMTFWKDVIQAKRTRDSAAPYVTPPYYRREHPVADPRKTELDQLLEQSGALLNLSASE